MPRLRQEEEEEVEELGTKLGDVSNSRAAQNWESSVEGLGCVKLVAPVFAPCQSASNGHDLDPLRSCPSFERRGKCLRNQV